MIRVDIYSSVLKETTTIKKHKN